MATTIASAALVPVTPMFTNAERLALAGFLAGYSGLTRQAYELDLRQFASWCQQHQLHLFGACRADIEFFARDLEARGRARATITRRLCTVAGFYRYAVEEELLDQREPPLCTPAGASRCHSCCMQNELICAVRCGAVASEAGRTGGVWWRGAGCAPASPGGGCLARRSGAGPASRLKAARWSRRRAGAAAR